MALTVLHGVLAFALVQTWLLAALLGVWAHRVAGARLLVLFLFGVGVWVIGNELPNWAGPQWEWLSIRLVALAPLISAVFVHFCVVFCRAGWPRRWLVLAYGLGAATALYAQWARPGHLIHSPPFGYVAVPTSVGLLASVGWVVLALVGLTVLARGYLRARGPERGQIAAVAASCVWGALCMTGYLMAAMRLPVTPWPLYGLPAHSLILVYGVLRYRVFVVNAWARRALAWALLLALGLGVVALTPLLPFESRWVGGLAVAATCLALNGPVRRVAERLVFPGGQVSAADLAGWREALRPADSEAALAALASGLISRRLGVAVPVAVGDGMPAPSPDAPGLRCRADSATGWHCELQGWDAAPPGPRQVAELFGSVLAEAAERLAQAQAGAQRERERQLQARLAELGALAATVAHDIRNPLNIISMAVAGAPPATRQEVSTQVGRISHLAADLLDYAKPWQLTPTRFDLAERVRGWLFRWPTVALGAGWAQPLWVEADARRLEQAVSNLLANAVSAAGEARPDRPPTRVELAAESDERGLWLHVCDDGPGVPAEIRERLFEPFASRSPGGTGLGLAIVARVAAAHGGSVALTERAPWSTCFTLHLPAGLPSRAVPLSGSTA